MRKTLFAGLTVLDADEPVTTDNAAFINRDRDLIDRFLQLGAKTHRHTGLSGLESPVSAMGASAVGSAGTISADESFSIAYTLEDEDGGETIASPIISFSTPSPISPPFSSPDGEAIYGSGGNLPVDTYYYAFSFGDEGGGETPIGPARGIERVPGDSEAKISLSGFEAPMSSAGAASWRLYRAVGGGDFGFLASGTGDTYVDDGSVSPDCDLRPLPADINTTNGDASFIVALPSADAFVSESAFINVYMTNSGEFVGDVLLGQFPVSSAGQEVVYNDIELAEGQPPDVSNSIGGVGQIDPDTEILDWHWKRPVTSSAELGEGDEHDIRLAENNGFFGPGLYAVLKESAASPTDWKRLTGLFVSDEDEEGNVNASLGNVAGIRFRDSESVEVTAGAVGLPGTNSSAYFAFLAKFWKPPVQTVEELPSEGNSEGDVRAILGAATPTLYMYLEGEWKQIETGGGEVSIPGGGEAIYWTPSNTNIATANLDASEPDESYITGGERFTGLVVNTTYIYWADNEKGTIGRARLDGSEPEPEFIKDAAGVHDVDIDSTHIYWTNAANDTIGRARLDGTVVEKSFIEGASTPRGIAVNDEFIYWANAGLTRVARAKIDGTEVNQEFITTTTSLYGLSIDSTHVYWTAGSRIGRALLDGSNVETLFMQLDEGTPNLRHMHAGDEFLYWQNSSLGVGRSKKDGSEVNEKFIPGGHIAVTTGPGGEAAVESLDFIGASGVTVSKSFEGQAADIEIIGNADQLAEEGMGVIVITEEEKGIERPNRFKQYTWYCKVEPENLAPFDIWIEEGP